MASPIPVGTTAIIAAPINKRRAGIRFHNTSATQTIYMKKVPITGNFTTVSATDYEIRLLPDATTDVVGESFLTDAINSFMAIATAAGGMLAIYETSKVNLRIS